MPYKALNMTWDKLIWEKKPYSPIGTQPGFKTFWEDPSFISYTLGRLFGEDAWKCFSLLQALKMLYLGKTGWLPFSCASPGSQRFLSWTFKSSFSRRMFTSLGAYSFYWPVASVYLVYFSAFLLFLFPFLRELSFPPTDYTVPGKTVQIPVWSRALFRSVPLKRGWLTSGLATPSVDRVVWKSTLPYRYSSSTLVGTSNRM